MLKLGVKGVIGVISQQVGLGVKADTPAPVSASPSLASASLKPGLSSAQTRFGKGSAPV